MPARISPPVFPNFAAHLAVNGISRRSIADDLDYNPDTITNALSGRWEPTPGFRHRVADHLGVDEAWLFARPDQAIAERAFASARAQGLPQRVEDVAALTRVAEILASERPALIKARRKRNNDSDN